MASEDGASVNPVQLKLERIAKVFLTEELEVHALSNIHLEIQQGEYVAIDGPSGSGKTTLLSILGLLESPSSGNFWLQGRSVAALSASDRALLRNETIGFIFQGFNLIEDLSVWQNVELPLLYRKLPARERAQKVKAALDRVEMTHRRSHRPSQLSGGQQQRVAVARAIAGEPAILFADEPTGNLDSKNGDAVMAIMDDLHAAGTTLCIVTHNYEYSCRARRAIHVFDGRIVEDSSSRRELTP